jgi:sec-independent protein translocase protein TatC
MAPSETPENSQQKTVVEEAGGAMSFFDHLVELRKRLVNSLIGIGIGMMAGLAVAKPAINYIAQPMLDALNRNHLDPHLYYGHPIGLFSLYISIGLYLGIALAMPWVLYQVWLFVAPGLYKHERKAVASFISSSMLLFLCGVAFGYFVMLPQVLTLVVAFDSTGPIKPWIDINEYFSLILSVLLGLGVIFELPVVVFILSLFGIVTPKFMLKNFRYAMLIITVIAAIVTPTPGATTMLVFMAPMILLYFLGVLVSYLVVRNKRRRQGPPNPPPQMAEGQAS